MIFSLDYGTFIRVRRDLPRRSLPEERMRFLEPADRGQPEPLDARLADPPKAHNALARIRGLYAVEREAREEGLTGTALAAYRRRHTGPVVAVFGDWLAAHRPR